MGRKSFKITHSNMNEVYDYFSERAENYAAVKLQSCHDENELQKWCDKYVSEKDFTTMRNALRKRHQRSKQEVTNRKDKTITLRHAAYSVLEKLRAEDEMNDFSEVIEKYCEALYEMPQRSRKKLLKQGLM